MTIAYDNLENVLSADILTQVAKNVPTKKQILADIAPRVPNLNAMAGLPGGDKTKYIRELDNQRTAKLTLRGEAGNLVALSDLQAKMINIPYSREKVIFTPDELKILQAPGPNGGRARDYLIDKKSRELANRHVRLFNVMLATALFTGVVTITQDAISLSIDYGIPAGNKTDLAGDFVWGGSTDAPVTDLSNMKTAVERESGLNCGRCYSDLATFVLFLKNAGLEATMGRKAQDVMTALRALPDFLGITWHIENGGYKNDSGTFVPYLAANKVIFVAGVDEGDTSDNVIWLEEGAVADLAAPDGAVGKFNKLHEQAEPSALLLIAEDNALPVLGVPEAVGILTVD